MKSLAAIVILSACALPLKAQDWVGHVGVGGGVPVNGFNDDVKGGVSATVGLSRTIGQHFMLGAFYKYNRYSLTDKVENSTLEMSSGSLQGRLLFRAASSTGVIPFVGLSIEGIDALATTIHPETLVRYTDKETLVGATPSIGAMIPIADIAYIEPSASYQWRSTTGGDEIGTVDVTVGVGFKL